jgi:hypothetical protein
MKLIKLLLALAALVFVVWGAFALLGLVASLFKWLLVLGVIALAGAGAYKLLSGSDEGARQELTSAEAEMLKADRLLDELRRRQLSE